MDLKKIIAKLPTGYAGEAAAMGAEELRREVLTATGRKNRIVRERDHNEELQKAKELAKSLAGAFSDAIKTEDAKLAYLTYLLDDKGKPLLSIEQETLLDEEAQERGADRDVILGREEGSGVNEAMKGLRKTLRDSGMSVSVGTEPQRDD